MPMPNDTTFKSRLRAGAARNGIADVACGMMDVALDSSASTVRCNISGSQLSNYGMPMARFITGERIQSHGFAGYGEGFRRHRDESPVLHNTTYRDCYCLV